MYNVSVLIPIHNRIEITKLGLSLLYSNINNYTAKSSGILLFSIVVIDDGSTDGSYEWIKNNYPEIYLLKEDGNLWWSGAINVGAKYAIEVLSADYVLLWNDDTYCNDEYFFELEKCIKTSPSYIHGSLIIDAESKKKWSCIKYFYTLLGTSSYRSPKTVLLKKYYYSWLTGMGTLIPTYIIKKIGYWNSNDFPQYFGDMDFTLRASKSGFNVSCNNKLRIYNRTEYSSYIGSDFKSFVKSLKKNNLGSRYNMSIRYKFYKKHCITPLYNITFLLYYLKYAYKTFIDKK